jgi:predicted phage terminase large subunit-like protein
MISRRLARAAFDGGTRLLVELPPRHGKSLLTSVWFPAWFLEHFQQRHVVLASYAESLAKGFGRQARNVLAEHFGELSTQLADDSQAAEEFRTVHGSSMVSVGVGGGLTGRGADVLIIDDAVKDSEAASSATQRDALFAWFESVALTRLEPNASVIVMGTRWHLDDLIGRLIAKSVEGGEQWERIRLPALAEEDDPLGRRVGAALWPERFDRAALESRKATMSARAWSALYQQSPIAGDSCLFARPWFQIVDAVPDGLMRPVRAWDMAATAGGDWTAGARCAFGRDGKFYVLDMRRKRGTPLDVEQFISVTARNDGRETRVRMEIEPGSAGLGQIERYRTVLHGYAFKGERPESSKEVRAETWSAWAQAGRVVLVRGPWVNDFLNEVEPFPNGPHDDQVDAVSLAFATAPRHASGPLRASESEQHVPDEFAERDRYDAALAKGEPWAVRRSMSDAYVGGSGDDGNPEDRRRLFRSHW